VTVDASAAPATQARTVARDAPDRLGELETTVDALRAEVADLRSEIAEFRRLLE
jgi:cell division protein FtsB